MVWVLSLQQFVSDNKILLSLRPSRGGSIDGLKPQKSGTAAPETVDVSSLVEGASLQGYVKSVTSSGVFVALDRENIAR